MNQQHGLDPSDPDALSLSCQGGASNGGSSGNIGAPFRQALYFQPRADTALAEAGRAWLNGEAVSPSPWSAWLEAPRRYGFHATIKAPFRLSGGERWPEFCMHVRRVVEQHRAIELPALVPIWFGDFLALRPKHGDPSASHPLRILADECISSLDCWRASLSDGERARRRPASISAQQRRNLDRWGYPHVFGCWRFHLTLSGPCPASVDDDTRHSLLEQASRHFAVALSEPIVLSDIALAIERTPGADFAVAERVPLGA